MAKKPTQKTIEILGARTHNLKNVNASIPQGKLTVITGPSGSGKSSLAFDTLYAEGQRRFVESMSTYARQFIEKMERPDVDQILNIQPAIAIEQKNSVKNARSSIGTATEISDYLRLLFAKGGKTICPECREEVHEDSPQSVASKLLKKMNGERIYVVAPLKRNDEVEAQLLRAELIRAGFTRIYTGGDSDGGRPFVELEDVPESDTSYFDGDVVRVVIDRLALDAEDIDRISSAVSSAFMLSRGTAEIYKAKMEPGEQPIIFLSGYRCNRCAREFPVPDPNLFSFNSPVGACRKCNGFGRVTGVDWARVIPDMSLSLQERPIAPFNTPKYRINYSRLFETAKQGRVPIDLPLDMLAKDQIDILKYGYGGRPGIQEFFDTLGEEKYKVQSRIVVARYRGFTECPDCHGSRLTPDALNVYWIPEKGGIKRLNMAEMSRMSIEDLLQYWESLELSEHETELIGRVHREILVRLQYLSRVGLGYLMLDRQTRTLSGGESQRINLATALGTSLTRTLYVLDEPTVGLHPRDSRRLLGILHDLRDLGNTVVVVEHDPELILGADNLIDIGPNAGSLGGQLMYEGAPDDLLNGKQDTLTKKYLLEARGAARQKKSAAKAPAAGKRALVNPIQKVTGQCVKIIKATENNLKKLTVEIPLHQWVCITGVSGSGKSTLVHKILYEGFNEYAKRPVDEMGHFESIEGFRFLDDIILIDQSAIGRSIRSNPVTYVKAYDPIRKLMASTREAKTLGITESMFSFNIPGGRCETCEGTGVTTYDMHFLAEITLPCEMCGGKRFGARVLEIRYKDKNIDDILSMTVDDARQFFADQPPILRRMQPLVDVGLGYLTLGQNTATLSGGEAQRLKLASHLAVTGAGRGKMMIFDEPTTGLHLSDLEVLSKVFRKLVDQGYSLVIIEHNLEIIRQADWIIDLGPEAGIHGGELVACGSPTVISQVEESRTGQFLKEIL